MRLTIQQSGILPADSQIEAPAAKWLDWKSDSIAVTGYAVVTTSLVLSILSIICAERVEHVDRPTQDWVGGLAIAGACTFMLTFIGGVAVLVKHYRAKGREIGLLDAQHAILGTQSDQVQNTYFQWKEDFYRNLGYGLLATSIALSIASLVLAERITDVNHPTSDIKGGIAIGTTCGFIFTFVGGMVILVKHHGAKARDKALEEIQGTVASTN